MQVEIIERTAARFLRVSLAGPHDLLSWAVVNGGARQAADVVWREVRPGELRRDVDARTFLRGELEAIGLPGAVGLLTGRDVRTFDDVTVEDSGAGLRARCIATVGLGNALAAGDPVGGGRGTGTYAAAPVLVGTINILCAVSVPLSPEALVEVCALASEARTAAMLDARIGSARSTRPATGTGTDCIVVASPLPDGIPPIVYAGKHTAVGSALGGAVREAIARGIARFLREPTGA